MRVVPSVWPLLLLLACEDAGAPRNEDSQTGADPDDVETGDGGVVAGSIAVAPSSVEADTIFVGQTVKVAIMVSNIGRGPIHGTLSVVGGRSANWTLDTYTSAAAPGEMTTHTATLTPTEWGDYSVSILVDDVVSAGHFEIPVAAHVEVDDDADGFGSRVSGGDDCDDTDDAVNPGAEETWYDGVDSDCGGENDNDQDGDGYNLGSDCDDTDANATPGGAEIWYDGIDGDCDGADDFDQDGDGHASAAYVGDDCNDLDAMINPLMTEVWYDGVDADCDGRSDQDQDRDGVDVSTDCMDTDASVFPGAVEIWYDGIDSNCAGDDDSDQDMDGVAYPTDCNDTDATVIAATTETWDGIDNDCDGKIDDFSVTDVASGVVYGSTADMWLGNKGQMAMDADVTGDGLADLVLLESETSYGYAWVLKGADAAAANGKVDSYDVLTVSGERNYTLTYVDGPFADVDGDGTHDTLLGGYYLSLATLSPYGRIYEFAGGTTGTKSVSSYNARFSSPIGAHFDANSHGVGGDVDGDGQDDVVIGAFRDDYSPGSTTSDVDCGSIQFFAGPVSSYHTSDDADDLVAGYTSYDYLGVSLSSADVDADGYIDIIAGASGYDGAASDGGAVFVVSGNASLAWSERVTDASAMDVDGNTGSLALGEDSLAHPGDVDGDGKLDLGFSSEEAGYAWLFLDAQGISGSVNISDADYIVSGSPNDMDSALVLDTDVDGDRADEFVVGCDGDDAAALNAGALFVFSHSNSWASTLTSADSRASIYGISAGDAFGSGATGGADLDGDGLDDLAVGAIGVDTSASQVGAVYVVPGR